MATKSAKKPIYSTNFTHVFTVTKVPVTPAEGHRIMKENGKPYDVQGKIAFYQSNGYVVSDIQP